MVGVGLSDNEAPVRFHRLFASHKEKSAGKFRICSGARAARRFWAPIVNGQPVKSNYKVKPGDTVVLYSDTAPDTTEIIPEEISLNIVYEDEEIMVINKPAGMVVHPGCGNYSGTVVNGMAWYLQQQHPELSEAALPRFGLVHRIDKNTSGLLVLAKNEKASLGLASQFAAHTVHRRYIALVWGDFEENCINHRVVPQVDCLIERGFYTAALFCGLICEVHQGFFDGPIKVALAVSPPRGRYGACVWRL